MSAENLKINRDMQQLKNNVLMYLIFVSCVGLMTLFSFCKPESNSPDKDQNLEILQSEHLRSFRVSDVYKRRNSTTYTLTNQEKILKIQVICNITKESEKILLADGIMSLEALYANALSPYPGDISKRIVSNKKFVPKFFSKTVNDRNYTFFILFANEWLGYGVRTEDVVKYKSLIGWLYDEETERFYKIRCFVPLETKNEDLEALFLSLGST